MTKLTYKPHRNAQTRGLWPLQRHCALALHHENANQVATGASSHTRTGTGEGLGVQEGGHADDGADLCL